MTSETHPISALDDLYGRIADVVGRMPDVVVLIFEMAEGPSNELLIHKNEDDLTVVQPLHGGIKAAYVQLVVLADGRIYGEAAGDANLPGGATLTSLQRHSLAKIGWEPPDSSSGGNWRRDFGHYDNVDASEVAHTVVDTFTSVYRYRLSGEPPWNQPASLPEAVRALLARAEPLGNSLEALRTRETASMLPEGWDWDEIRALAPKIQEIQSELHDISAEFSRAKRACFDEASPEERAAMDDAEQRLRILNHGEEFVANVDAKVDAYMQRLEARTQELKGEYDLLSVEELLESLPRLVERFGQARDVAVRARRRTDTGDEAADLEFKAMGSALEHAYEERWSDIRQARLQRAESDACRLAVTRVTWDPDAHSEEWFEVEDVFRQILNVFEDPDEDATADDTFHALLRRVIHLGQPLIVTDQVSLRDAIAFKQASEFLGVTVKIDQAPPQPTGGREPIPERVRNEVWRRDRGRCVDCGSRERLEFDHIIPVSKGGANTARNIELRCESCNRRKAARI